MVSGLHQDTPASKVKAILAENKEGLTEGLLQFKTSNSDAKLEKLLKDGKQEKLLPFTKHLQGYLNLDADQTWSTLCAYLVNEYKGSPGSLAAYVANETNKWKLIADIWNYYSLERMIILKLIKNLLEFQREKRHPYREAYSEWLEQITLRKLKSKIIDQLTTLLKEDPESAVNVGGDQQHEFNQVTMLYGRTLREINELIHILVLISEIDGTSPEEFKLFLDVFKNSAFLQKCKYNSSGDVPAQLQQIEHSRVILLLLSCHQSPSDLQSWNSSVLKSIDDTIVGLSQTAENGPLLLAWMIKNFKATNQSEMNNPRNYHNCGTKAIKLDVFKYLFTVLTSKTFQNKPGNLLATTARRLVYNILNDLCDLFDGDGSVAQRNYIYDLLAELLTTPSIAIDFIKRAQAEDESNGCVSLYNTAIELFPIELIAISKIAGALAGSATKNGSEFVS